MSGYMFGPPVPLPATLFANRAPRPTLEQALAELDESPGATTEQPEIDVAREVGTLVQVLCNRERSAQKCSWDDAWQTVNTLHPELYFLMSHPQPGEDQPFQNRSAAGQAQRASRRVLVLRNRAVRAEGMTNAEADALVREREPRAFERMKGQDDRSHVNVPTHMAASVVRRLVSQALGRIRLALPGASFEEVWDAFKTREQEAFAMLLAYTE